MCDYCGCRTVPLVRELMEEHDAILDDASDVRVALESGDRAAVMAALVPLAGHLAPHVRREELGIFTALRRHGDFVDEVEALEGEHVDLDQRLAALDPGGDDFVTAVHDLLESLAEHIERENLGVFPVSVVSLDAEGWDLVGRVAEEIPTFVTGPRS